MSHQPYTDDDLRAMATRVHSAAARDTDGRIRRVVEQWRDAQFTSEQVDEVGDALITLLDRTPDVSEWAVGIGADGLEPDCRTIEVNAEDAALTGDGQPRARLHLAFSPDVQAEERNRFISRLTQIITSNH